MEEKKKSKLKKFFESISRPFKALTIQEDEDKELNKEIEELKIEQTKLKSGEDYTSNVTNDFVPKVDVKNVKYQYVGNKRKKEEIEYEK